MRDTEWFWRRGYGVFVHLLHDSVNKKDSVRSMGKETSWDECLRDFDCDLYADTLKEMGAGYTIVTIMQTKKYMLAPNETYNRITGYKNGEACPTFDFIEVLYEALKKRDIDLMLYFTGDGPADDEIAGNAFGYRGYTPGNNRITMDFLQKWASVLEEYSIRYGTKVKGWWLDGMPGCIGYDVAETQKILTDAARAGNPDAIVACNHYGVLNEWGGMRLQVRNGTQFCDYTAGEMVYFQDVPVAPYIGNARWHILSHLAKAPSQYAYNGWGHYGSNYTSEYLCDYYQKVHEHGGVMSIDLCVYRDGHIDEEQVRVVSSLKNLKI